MDCVEVLPPLTKEGTSTVGDEVCPEWGISLKDV